MDQPLSIYIDALSIAHTHRSGVAHTLHRTLEFLLKEENNYNIVLVVPLRKAKLLPEDIIKSKKVTIKTIPLPGKVFELFLRLRLVPPVDLFLGKGVYVFPNFKNWPLWNSRSITYIHDLTFMRYPDFVEEKNLKYLTRYIHRWINRADCVVTVSEHAKREINELLHVPESAINVIYNGVDAESFKPQSVKKIAETKQRYELPSEYLLAVGNVEPRKNLERLVAVYTKLPKDIRTKYPLVLVGGGGWRNEGIQQAIDQANKTTTQIIKPSKYVEDDDLPALIAGARAFVHPALYEGFGIPPLEAMACNVPVASSDSSSLPEVVGEAAALFAPTNENEMKKAILAVLSDEKLRQRYKAAGLERAQLFTWKQSAIKLSATITQQANRGFKTGSFGHVLRSVYKTTDETIRKNLGERDYASYTMADQKDLTTTRKKIYQDFFSEQPKRWQGILFSVYLSARHGLGTVARNLKSLLRRMRG